MILSPDYRKVATNRSMRNLGELISPVSRGGMTSHGIATGAAAEGMEPGTSTKASMLMDENLQVTHDSGPLFAQLRVSHKASGGGGSTSTTLVMEPSSVSDRELLSKHTAELASQTANQWSTILKNIPRSPPQGSTSSTRLRRRDKKSGEESSASLAPDETKTDVSKTRREGGPRSKRKKDSKESAPTASSSFRPILVPPQDEMDPYDPMVSSRHSLSPRLSSALGSSIPPSPTDIIPISLSMSEKYPPHAASSGEPFMTSYPNPQPHHGALDKSESEGGEEEVVDYGSGCDDSSCESSWTNGSCSPVPTGGVAVSGEMQGRLASNHHSSSSLVANKSSHSIHQSMYHSLSPTPIPGVPSAPPLSPLDDHTRRTSEYKPSTLLANVLSLPDNIIAPQRSFGCFALCSSKGNVVHVIDEPPPSSLSPSGCGSENDPLDSPHASHSQSRSFSWFPSWMTGGGDGRRTTTARARRRPYRGNNHHYTMASLRSSVYPADILSSNNGMDI
jgi:hypothetical protein